MIKTLNKVGIGGMYLNILKAIFDKVTAKITLNNEQLKVFLLRSETRQELPTLTAFIQHSIGNPSQRKQARQRNKRHPNQKGRSKPSPFTGNMILYTGNPKDSIKKL